MFHHTRGIGRAAGTALAAAIAVAALTTAARAQTCPQDGDQSPAALHTYWIMVGWEKNLGDPPLVVEDRLGHLYSDTSDSMRLYDDFDTENRVATSARAYSDIWTGPFNSMKAALHQVLDGPDVIVADKQLAASALEFAALLTTADNQIVAIRTRSSTVWQCEEVGWQIVREHNSSHVVQEQELLPFFQ